MHQPNEMTRLSQVAALRSIGLKLSQTRELHERDLGELALKTHIPITQLAALEISDLSQLPAPMEIRSLIRQYANALGLNGLRLASAFPLESVKSAPRWMAMIQRPRQAFRLSPAQLYGAYILMTIGVIQGLSIVLSAPESDLPIVPKSTSTEPMLPHAFNR